MDGGTGDSAGGDEDVDLVEDADDLGPVGTVSVGLFEAVVGDCLSLPFFAPMLLPLLLLFIMSDSILLHARVSMANGLLLASNCCLKEENKKENR